MFHTTPLARVNALALLFALAGWRAARTGDLGWQRRRRAAVRRGALSPSRPRSTRWRPACWLWLVATATGASWRARRRALGGDRRCWCSTGCTGAFWLNVVVGNVNPFDLQQLRDYYRTSWMLHLRGRSVLAAVEVARALRARASGRGCCTADRAERWRSALASGAPASRTSWRAIAASTCAGWRARWVGRCLEASAAAARAGIAAGCCCSRACCSRTAALTDSGRRCRTVARRRGAEPLRRPGGDRARRRAGRRLFERPRRRSWLKIRASRWPPARRSSATPPTCATCIRPGSGTPADLVDDLRGGATLSWCSTPSCTGAGPGRDRAVLLPVRGRADQRRHLPAFPARRRVACTIRRPAAAVCLGRSERITLKLSIVVPCFNERATVHAARSGPRGRPRRSKRRSSSSTTARPTARASFWREQRDARRHRAVTCMPRNGGKGAAVQEGLQARDRRHGAHPGRRPGVRPGRLPDAAAADPDGQAKVVYGSRFLGEHKAMYFWHAVGQQDADAAHQHPVRHHADRHGDLLQGLHADIARPPEAESNRWGFDPEITAKIMRWGTASTRCRSRTPAASTGKARRSAWRDGPRVLLTLLRYRFSSSGVGTPRVHDSFRACRVHASRRIAVARWRPRT